MTRTRGDGQVLVLFAICLTALIGISALVVDIGLKYSIERRYQSIADAASLAGAQELQPVTRSSGVTVAMQNKARAAALRAIANELAPGTTPTCVDWTNCDLPGGRYNVAIITPSMHCVQCEIERAVEVHVAEKQFSTTFARLFGQTAWRLERRSVAGLSFGRSYTIVALRPPRPRNGSSIEVRDIFLNGGTKVFVRQGDVGTNSNMDYGSTTNTQMVLDFGYRMYYYDPDPAGPDWGANPPGTHISTLIEDPNYPIPAVPGPAAAPVTGADPACGAKVDTLLTDATFSAYASLVPRDTGTGGAVQYDKVACLSPGSYATEVKDSNSTQKLTILAPGLYYFGQGMDINFGLIGGYDPAAGGVSLMFPRDEQFFQRAGSSVILNAGTKWRNSAGTEPATAPVMTGGTPSLKVTLVVQKDPNCQVLEPYNYACRDPGSGGGSSTNQSLNLGGGAAIYLAGVQYGASDNIKIAGNTSGAEGYLGQIWAWTIEYVGSTTVNQQGSASDGPGRIRIDTACSPGTACN